MRAIRRIFVHCTASKNGGLYSIEQCDIDHGKREPPLNRKPADVALLRPNLKHVGYHAMIYVDGSIHRGRGDHEVPAAQRGHNHGSLAVCLVGTDRFTAAQVASLKELCKTWKTLYPTITMIRGHNEVSNKTCPGFDVGQWVKDEMRPSKQHLWPVP